MDTKEVSSPKKSTPRAACILPRSTHLLHGSDGIVRKHGPNYLIPDVFHCDAVRVDHVRLVKSVISQVVSYDLIARKVRNMPGAPLPDSFPYPRQPQQIDRRVGPSQQMRLAPAVFDGTISPVSHRANREQYPCGGVGTEHVGQGAVQSLGDLVHGHYPTVEVVRREFVAVGYVLARLLFSSGDMQHRI